MQNATMCNQIHAPLSSNIDIRLRAHFIDTHTKCDAFCEKIKVKMHLANDPLKHWMTENDSFILQWRLDGFDAVPKWTSLCVRACVWCVWMAFYHKWNASPEKRFIETRNNETSIKVCSYEGYEQ